ncbi:XRE family transcriptional regulator [Pseudomonas sp. RP23018S]|uniref:XRE family transcriptional regulator n=1 Tax=Pseudomonas sp. RP23018S TaxID=3096037 RepID=UPI002ACA2127|nr:XRE family transcriptional regulator [Pseudomonas sp. RP23018S]MDZ5604609.1 XRE family transcriptional regulator [Pseudomonas sp. RP23018S]
MSEHFAANLKLACSHYRSISEVCRQLAMNRAQFNKYLSGQSQPTRYNLKRIGDFFGVEDYELGLPPEQFARLIGARTTAQAQRSQSDPFAELFQPLHEHCGNLSRYCGYYFEYANSMSVPGMILLSLVHVREERGRYLFERQERQERSSSTNVQSEDWVRCRYLGAAFQLQDRLFMVDYESLTVNEISQTILIPSFKSRITRLNGLKIGVSSGDRRTPACTRVLWEFLGVEINRINAYRQVKLYHPDDPRIDDDVRERLSVGPITNGLLEIE